MKTVVTIAFLLASLTMTARQSGQNEVFEKLHYWHNIIVSLIGAVPYMNEHRLQTAETESTYIQQAWNDYVNMHADEITDDCTEITDLMAEFPAEMEKLSNAIEQQKEILKADEDIAAAVKAFENATSRHEAMLKRAKRYMQTEKTAPLLEQLKAEEQLAFTALTQKYTAAQKAVEANGTLKNKFAQIKNEYIKVSAISKQIQETEFKPWIERIRDYLVGLAALGIILLFFNMLTTKIKAAKDARESAAKYAELMRKANDDTPVI